MLIKVYPLSAGPSQQQVHIIEKATEVMVDRNIYPCGHCGNMNNISTYKSVDDAPENYQSSHVDYENEHGTRTRLQVTNFAYICTDDGKTIERIDMGGINQDTYFRQNKSPKTQSAG